MSVDPSRLPEDESKRDERKERNERSRWPRLVGAPEEPTSFVQVEATLLKDLSGYQEDLWDYVEGLMVTSELAARCQRLVGLSRQTRDVETASYWEAIDSLLGMQRLADSMSAGLHSLLDEDSKLVIDFDAALGQASNGVQEALNDFPSAEEFETIRRRVLGSATTMSQTSFRLALLCKNGAQDQAENAKLCVNRIIAQVRSATATPLVDAPLQTSKAPGAEEAGSAYSDPREHAHEDVAGADPENRQRGTSSAPGTRPEVEAHMLNPLARDWRAADDR